MVKYPVPPYNIGISREYDGVDVPNKFPWSAGEFPIESLIFT